MTPQGCLVYGRRLVPPSHLFGRYDFREQNDIGVIQGGMNHQTWCIRVRTIILGVLGNIKYMGLPENVETC